MIEIPTKSLDGILAYADDGGQGYKDYDTFPFEFADGNFINYKQSNNNFFILNKYRSYCCYINWNHFYVMFYF